MLHNQYIHHLRLIKAQELAARYPELGIFPDSLIHLPYDDLYGTMRFLESHHWQEKSNV